jgi:hypothetical protein
MRHTLYFALAFFTLQAASVWAAFELPPDSARASGMGRAFLASNHEPGAVFGNAAGIAGITAPEASFMYDKPFAGLENLNLAHGHLAVVVPSRHGNFGLGYAQLHASGLLTEQTAALTYAARPLSYIQAGVTVKILTHAYTPNAEAAGDPVFKNGTRKSALTLDASVNFAATSHLVLGAAVRNLNEPDVGLVSTDKVQREIQTGAALRVPGLGMRFVGDLMVRSNPSGVIKSQVSPFLGVEKVFNNTLAFRAGINRYEYTGGFGVKVGTMRVEYALVVNRDMAGDSAGSHKMELTWRFAKKRTGSAGTSGGGR